MFKKFVLAISSTYCIPHGRFLPIFAVFWHKFDINCNLYACSKIIDGVKYFLWLFLPSLCLKSFFGRFQAHIIHHMADFYPFSLGFFHKCGMNYHKSNCKRDFRWCELLIFINFNTQIKLILGCKKAIFSIFLVLCLFFLRQDQDIFF